MPRNLRLIALAGALLASHGKYVSPNLLHWTQSGTLMIMVILGGVGYLYGGLIGAVDDAVVGEQRLVRVPRLTIGQRLIAVRRQHG